jgi:hypothetical protein
MSEILGWIELKSTLTGVYRLWITEQTVKAEYSRVFGRNPEAAL